MPLSFTSTLINLLPSSLSYLVKVTSTLDFSGLNLIALEIKFVNTCVSRVLFPRTE